MVAGRANLSKLHPGHMDAVFPAVWGFFGRAGPYSRTDLADTGDASPLLYDLWAPVTPGVLAVTFPGSRRPHRLSS